jgi:predicted dehydrogenase
MMNRNDTVRLGVIGIGGRAQGMLKMIERCGHKIDIVAVCDVKNPDELREMMTQHEWDHRNTTFYTDADQMLDKEKLDGVMIGTRCSLHAKMAMKVLSRDLPLFLEKPIATNMDDLLALRNAAATTKSEVVVSFPLRVTQHCQVAKQIIDSGKIGTVEHVQAWNDVPYGECYYQAWYRDENETQGLWLQKATHDFDYITYLLGYNPVRICAMKSKQVFKGDKPAGLKCKDCDEWDDCEISPFHRYMSSGIGRAVTTNEHQCAFAVDTGNEDSGSAIVMYDTGMHVSYSQNFFARKGAGRRGARLYGYKGTVDFDWYTNEVRVYLHQSTTEEVHKINPGSGSHSGGDPCLADNFVRIIRGEQKSVSPLSAGLLSVLMCLKAKESCLTNTFQEIAWP